MGLAPIRWALRSGITLNGGALPGATRSCLYGEPVRARSHASAKLAEATRYEKFSCT